MKKLICLIAAFLCCAAMFTACTAVHEHGFAEKWSYDETNHWHAATCGHDELSEDKDLHDFDDGAETTDGIKYTCKVCGYFKFESKIEPLTHTVTAEEFASIMASVEKFKVDYVSDSGTLTITVGDSAILIDYGSDVQMYYSCEGENYYVYDKDDEDCWVKDPIPKKDYENQRSSFDIFTLVKDYFEGFSFDEKTKTYNADEIVMGDEADALAFKNVSLAFENKKLIALKFSLTVTYDDVVENMFYTYSEIGTDSVSLPANVHEHTYSDEWSANVSGHYHAATCGHYVRDYGIEKHDYVKGICSVCGFNALMLSEDGKTVIGIYEKNLSTVTFPQGVTAIGDFVFAEYEGFTEIEIPEGVKTIGSDAFYNCPNLTKVTIPDGLTSIGNGAFEQCSKLTEIEIPGSVTTIGFYAFAGCSTLTKVSFGEGVSVICDRAFEGCLLLSDITLPTTLTDLGNNAFGGCNAITRVIVPDSVTTIGNGAFANCSSLTFIKMSGGIQSIKSNAFADCSALKTAVISEGTTALCFGAFGGCTALEKLVLPKSLNNILTGVLKDSDKLEAICYSGTQSEWNAVVNQALPSERINLTPVYFYSETEPAEEGNFWHYDENGEIVLLHTHTFSKDWSHNETHHWHAADCGHADAVSEYAEHDFIESGETEEGTVYTCSCGYVETRSSRYRVSEESFSNLIKNAISFRVAVNGIVYDRNDSDWKVNYSDGRVGYYTSDNGAYYTYYLEDGSTDWIKKQITQSEYNSDVKRLNQMPYIAELFNELTYDADQKCYKGVKVISGGNELTELYCYFKDGKLRSIEFVTQGIRFVYTEFDNVEVALPENVREQ